MPLNTQLYVGTIGDLNAELIAELQRFIQDYAASLTSYLHTVLYSFFEDNFLVDVEVPQKWHPQNRDVLFDLICTASTVEITSQTKNMLMSVFQWNEAQMSYIV